MLRSALLRNPPFPLSASPPPHPPSASCCSLMIAESAVLQNDSIRSRASSEVTGWPADGDWGWGSCFFHKMRRAQPREGIPIPAQRHQQNQPHLQPILHPASPAAGHKSRLKRLLPTLHRPPSSERLVPGDHHQNRAVEPSSICLGKMVHGFLEGDNSSGDEGRSYGTPAAAVLPTSSPSSGGGRSRSGSFHTNCFWVEESPEDYIFESPHVRNTSLPPTVDTSLVIKNLLLHASPLEKSLITDVSAILEKPQNKLSSSSSAGSGSSSTRTHRLAALVEGLVALGHDASICRTRSVTAGEHEFADVLFPCGERLIIEPDFRYEFQIARPTKDYRAALSMLPVVFVGTPERLKQVVTLAAGAAKKSMKKKGFDVPPWRKKQYMQDKWLSPGHKRVTIADAIAEAAKGPAMPFATVPVVADAGCWGNFGAVATATVAGHRNRPARVAPAFVGFEQVRGINNARSASPASTRSRATPPVKHVGWFVAEPGPVV